MNKKTAILLALSAIQALAADNTFTLDTLSVTALREEESVQSQPLSIATKQANEIELDQVIFQKDLLNSFAGVRIEQTGSIIGHKTSIRMPMTTDPYYLFLQDGIPVQSSGFFNHNGLAYTTFGSASSVEVLKGTGTALYGSDAMAGTINVIGASEASKKFEQSVAVSGGSDGFGSLRGDVSNTPNNKSSYRFGARYDHGDGWREHTAFDRLEANGRYDYLIDNDNSVKVMVSATKSVAEQADDFQNYSNIENGSTLASDQATYYTALSKTDVRRKFDYARIAAEFTNYAFDDAELSFTPYLRYNRNQYVATWEKPNYPSNDSIQKSIGLMQKTKFTPSWGRLIVGFDTEYTQADQKTNQEFDYNATIVTGLIYDYSVDYFALAPYIHTDYKITDALMTSIGLRYDFNRYDYKNNLADGNVYNLYYRTTDRTDSYSHLSPKLSLSYRPMEDVDLYARYANGFRIPQSTMLYSLKKGYETYGLDPEISDTYEVGVKYGNTNHYIELAGYYMTIDNTFTQYDNGTVKYYGNGGEGIHKGIEVGASTKLNNEIELKGAYSHSRHNYNNNPTFKDKEMANAPQNTANGRIFYSPKGLMGLVMMGELQYVGSYWMDDANTRRYGGYCIGNLKADYKVQSGLSVFAKVTNLTDERYAVSATYAYNRASYTPGDPRQFFAGLEYTW